jgi:hypothetical protein
LTKKKIVNKIQEVLDNLSVVKISNKQKAEAIYSDLEAMFQEELGKRNIKLQPVRVKGNDDATH